MFLVILASCSMPGIGVEGDEGSMAITVDGGPMMTLLPPIDMTPVTFSITGAGPEGRSFSQSTASSSVTVSGLVFGTWTVTVAAKNGGNTVIGQGTGSAVVHTGGQTSLAITVKPLPGNGTLALGVTWVTADVPTPSINAQLLPATGPSIPLAFVMSTGSATCLKSGIAAGYYTLSLKLLDNGVLVMGAVEVVRIVTGQTTSGSFDFTLVNKGTGDITVTITPVMSDPIPVTMTGQLATLASGASMTVTAAVPASVGNVTYVLYLNGESKAAGTSASPNFTLGSALHAGFYRLDVTAITADGMRAGAVTHRFTVQ
ncbi:MAG: hypothetical protein NTU62_08720 [Spirochaetes bacterium]|nr:hypothetical protein [Spirochaetota bacterium]